VRGLLPKEKRGSPNNYKFMVASEEDNDRLSGYSHNSVSPFGMLSKHVPIIFPVEAAEEVDFVWMGGGHVDLKVGVSVGDLKRSGVMFAEASTRS